MTRLLAIETSGSVCSVAVAIDGSLVTSIEILHANVHDALLSRCVRDAIDHAGLDISDIDIVAVSSGPGSFTGLRIGASFVKGLCFSGHPSMLAVPTLTSLLHASSEVATLAGYESITAVVASHRDLVYCATSPVHDAAHTPDVQLMSLESAKALVSPRTMVVGPAAALLAPFPISGLTRLSARFVAFAAWRLLETGASCTDVMTFVPDYRQDFVPKS